MIGHKFEKLKESEERAKGIIERAERKAEEIRRNGTLRIAEMHEKWRADVESDKKALRRRIESETRRRVAKILADADEEARVILKVRKRDIDKVAEEALEIVLLE